MEMIATRATDAAVTADGFERVKRSAEYVRVSSNSRTRKGDTVAFDQDPAVQEAPLRQLIAQRGWQVHEVYSDRMSGSKERRPGLDRLMADAKRGKVDVVVVWRFDRFARSVRQLVNALEEFRGQGIDFVSHQEAVDTSTPMGKAMFTMIEAMAEFERSLICERVMAGIEHARYRGTKSGKALGRPRVIFRRDRAIELRKRGKRWREIATEWGVGQRLPVCPFRGPCTSRLWKEWVCHPGPEAPACVIDGDRGHEPLSVRVPRGPDAGVPVHAGDYPAVSGQDQRADARPYRPAHRSAGRTV